MYTQFVITTYGTKMPIESLHHLMRHADTFEDAIRIIRERGNHVDSDVLAESCLRLEYKRARLKLLMA